MKINKGILALSLLILSSCSSKELQSGDCVTAEGQTIPDGCEVIFLGVLKGTETAAVNLYCAGDESRGEYSEPALVDKASLKKTKCPLK